MWSKQFATVSDATSLSCQKLTYLNLQNAPPSRSAIGPLLGLDLERRQQLKAIKPMNATVEPSGDRTADLMNAMR